MQNSKVKIINKPLIKSEAKIILNEIRQSPNITGYSLHELLNLKTVFKAYVDDNFVGVCANFDFEANWTELSAFIISPKFRGQGIGKKLFSASWADAISRKKNIFIVSRNPVMIKILEETDLKILSSFWQLPLAVIIHELIFSISWYRVKEFIRKLSMKKPGRFVFGIKMAA